MKINKIIFRVINLLFFSTQLVKAQNIHFVHQYKNWAAYYAFNNNQKICYAITKPIQILPEDKDHGHIFFFVTLNKVNNIIYSEPSITVGYQFRYKSNVKIDIDGMNFIMKTDKKNAWINNRSQAQQLTKSMKLGHEMIVRGESSRGTHTTYRFSLVGLTSSINSAKLACNYQSFF